MVHQSGLQGEERGPNTRQRGSSDHSHCKLVLPSSNAFKADDSIDHGTGLRSGSALVSGKTCISSITGLRQTSALEIL